MSAPGIIATVLGTQLAQAMMADLDRGEEFNPKTGTFGPNVSQWLRDVARTVAKVPADA